METAPPPPDPDVRLGLAAGRTFGSFRLLAPLGSGGAGEVWEAQELATGRRLALKVLTQVNAESPDARARFEREGRLAASLNHPSCVYVLGAAEIEGRPTITMELMRGGTLHDRIRSGGLTVQEAVDFAIDIVDGLEGRPGTGYHPPRREALELLPRRGRYVGQDR